jgi:transcriptional regulator with XRE-family HTH domain
MTSSKLLKEMGAHLRALREAQGITQESFAAKVDLDRAYYGKLERGEVNISILRLGKIAGALHIKLSVLLENIKS